MRALAVEHARHGIRSNAVLPGWIESEMTARVMANRKFVDRVLPRAPQRRWGTAADFAGIADLTGRFERKRETIRTKWAAEGIDPARIERALELCHPTGHVFLDLCLLRGGFGIDTAATWAKTTYGGHQFDLLDICERQAVDAGSSCDEWGACEY